MTRNLKLFLIVSLILCFLVFLYLRRKRLQENFNCMKLDQSIFCIKDKTDIDTFRRNQDSYYREEIPELSLYNFINFELDQNINTNQRFNFRQDLTSRNNFKAITNYKDFEPNRLISLRYDADKNLFYKYDFIKLENKEIDSSKFKSSGTDINKLAKIVTPGGVLFDPSNDDIVVFDSYRLRRFSYRDLKVKTTGSTGDSGQTDYYPILDSHPIEIKTQSDKFRDELIDIVYSFEVINTGGGDEVEINYLNDNYIDYLNIADDEIFQKLKDFIYDFMETVDDEERIFKINYSTLNSSVEYNKKSLLERVKVLEDSLKGTLKYKVCVDDLNNQELSKEKVCNIKYQKDLPSFDMGAIEGKGVEGMQYDDDRPNPTIIHSTYLDTRMEAWSNAWNNKDSEGIFSPMITDNKRKMKLYNKDENFKYKDNNLSGIYSKNKGFITGAKQQSIQDDPMKKSKIFNKTVTSPLARDDNGNKYLDEQLNQNKNINFFIETFENKKGFTVLNQNRNKNKINYGFPSIELNKDNNFNLRFSIGVYHIPDELDTTGIGMEFTSFFDQEDNEVQIILVPDVNNNRIQVFKKNKSELTFYGQFGNLDYTSYRSLPQLDNNTRYEPIHDTENYNSLPGCQKTCDFSTTNKYQGSRNVDFMNRKCLPWGDYSDDTAVIAKQQLNNEYKLEGLQEQDFIANIRQRLQGGEILGDKCLSLNDGKPVCIVDDDGVSVLSKCFPDYYDKENEPRKKEVNNINSCEAWMTDYTDRFGPIDANLCLGDNQGLPLTPEEEAEGKMPQKNCVFECNPRYSYRRANIHHRQTAFKDVNGEEKEVYRKRGHFYSLLDEYRRCADGIEYEKKNDKKVFEDAEFINPHFLGVDSQACVGKKNNDGECKVRDTRNTSGVDNCSLGYRKYLLKIIAATNQGQKFGQLFHPKSIAYDDVDKKYYVVDCYHHCVQCFEMEEDLITTQSGEKLSFKSADKELNEKHIFYYDENFKTGSALNYNTTEVYSLGLRQNMFYEKNFDKFSRVGEVSNEKSDYLKKLEEISGDVGSIPIRIQEFEDQRQIIQGLRDEWLLAETDRLKIRKAKIIIQKAEDLSTKYQRIKTFIEKIPLSQLPENRKRDYINELNRKVAEINTFFEGTFSEEVQRIVEEKKRERLNSAEERVIRIEQGPNEDWDPPHAQRLYPAGFWDHHGGHRDGSFSTTGIGYHHPPSTQIAPMLIPMKPGYKLHEIKVMGRRFPLSGWDQWPEYIDVELLDQNKQVVKKLPDFFYANRHWGGNNGAWLTLERRDRRGPRTNFVRTRNYGGRIQPYDRNVRWVRLTPKTWHYRPTFRAMLIIKRITEVKAKFHDNKRINERGQYVDNRGNLIPDPDDIQQFSIRTSDYTNQEEAIQSSGIGLESEQNKRFSKEKGFSVISPDWAKKYSDGVMRLNRWVSGISEWGNHVFKGFNEKIDYKKINLVGDFYFNTEKGGAGDYPGCGEFSYPSDIAITKNSCLGKDVQLMFITDTGNNRISIFKKYKINNKFRFRFYSFLGDDEEEAVNRKFVNPISVCVSEVSGNVFILESNFYDNAINSRFNQAQRIRVYYPDLKKKNYYFSHNIELSVGLSPDKFEEMNLFFNDGDNNKVYPRITKIRIDDRGILALTDINNNKVHLLKESISSDLKINNIDDSALNKIMVNVEFDPYKKFKTYGDIEKIPILNHDRLRFIFQRQRVCAFQNGDIILSKEFKTNSMPFTNYKKIFSVEDVIEQNEFDNCWVINTDTGKKYIPEDIINNNNGVKTREETNKPNFEVNKKYTKNGELNFYEDWKGRSLEPNSSYLYKVGLYNYHFIQPSKRNIDKIVHTYPVYLSDEDVTPKSILTPTENFINLGISYGYDSKKYNPICFTILRRIHNRTADICTKNINCVKGSKVQLFMPGASKNIFQIKSRPKFGRLLVYDIEKGGEFEENLFEMERSVDYGENKYLIFYSCEGGDEKIGGVSLPDSGTIGRGHLIDSFTLGDKLETIHTQITYNVHIDITKSDVRPVLFKDNDNIDTFMKYYQKEPTNKHSTDLKKLIKLSYARKINEQEYSYPGMLEYCDKGINDGNTIEPIEMNQTYEYVILVSNPFKTNPAVNSFYYTTKPEKPYIHSVEFDKLAMENEFNLIDGQDVARVKWYYPKNRSGYWPLNFLILRKDISNRPKALKPNSYDIDFTITSRPLPSDKLFRIQKHSLKLLNNSDPSSSGTFKRRYNLGKQLDWKIKLFGTPGITATLNGENYNWNSPYSEFNNIKFLDIEITLKGQQQITNITCDETVIIDENDTTPSESEETVRRHEEYRRQEERQENREIKEAVEDFRKRDGPNFIFKLADDYQGFYNNSANAPKTGYNGSLYNYIKDMSEENLLNIYDELSDEMKIYSGDVGLRMDGEGRTLRSGDKEMLIDKIRHFAFIYRQAQKTANKVLGIECNELSLDDIQIVTDNSGSTPKVQALICKNTDPNAMTPTFSPGESENTSETPGESPAMTAEDCSTLAQTGLRGENKIVITGVRTLAECCYKCKNSNECEVAEFKQSDEKCELHRSYNVDNEIANQNYSTLIGKTANTFDITEEAESEEPVDSDSNEVFVPPGKSDWEVLKIIHTEKRTGSQPKNLEFRQVETFVGSQSEHVYRPSIHPTDDEKDKIQSDFSFEPQIVSLSGDPEGLAMGPAGSSDVEFSSHEVLIPIPRGKRYSYKVAVYQTGFCMENNEKRKYLGVEIKDSQLGLGEVYSSEIELGESIQETVITNTPPILTEPTFKEPEVDRPVIKFFEPKEGDSNTIIRLVGLKLDEIEYFCFRDVKVPILKRQERIIGNVKYQEYLFKAPSIKELDRNCWQSIEKYKVLVWGYHHGYQIISSEGADDKKKMFTYTSLGDCEPKMKKN